MTTHTFPPRTAVNPDMLRRPQNTDTIKKYATDGYKLLLMTLRYTMDPASEDPTLEIRFLPSQKEAAAILHDVFYNKTCDEVGSDEDNAMESIQGLFSSLFFPPDDARIVIQGRHTPINCFFLATNLKKGGHFKSAQDLSHQINHIEYILRLTACKELEKVPGR